jgi:hypothetical protein
MSDNLEHMQRYREEYRKANKETFRYRKMLINGADKIPDHRRQVHTQEMTLKMFLPMEWIQV